MDMVASSKVESLTQRFAPYIEELQEFFANRRLAYGSPADLGGFVQRLGDPGFHDEMSSMVRSVLYRESEALPRTELMELLALAVGGPATSDDFPDQHDSLRRIFLFVTDTVRSQRAQLPPEETAEQQEIAIPVSLHIASADSAAEADSPLPDPGSLRFRSAEPPVNERLSRVLLSPGELTSGDREEPKVEPLHSSPVRPQQPPSSAVAGFLRRAYWIPGTCVLLVVLLATFALQRHNKPAGTRPDIRPPLPVLGAAKPSAYGAPVTGPRAGAPPLPATAAQEENTAPLRTGAEGASAQNSQAASPAPGSHTSVPATRAGHRSLGSTSHVTPRVLGGEEGVFLASSGLMASHLLNAPAPAYPKLASLAHVQGEVIVQVVVDRNGKVEATRVLEGPHLLRGAAEHTIRHWRYRPYVVDGKATDVATIVTVNFRLLH